MAESVYDFEAQTIDARSVSLGIYKGKTLLIVNTATQCGFSSQFKGLEKLHQDYANRDFEVLGFPCNQFAQQEPGSDSEIQRVCTLNFGVSFALFKKIDVNGDSAHPLYQYLKNSQPGFLGTKSIKWNFTKFLINKNGQPIKRYGPKTKPAAIAKAIEPLLKERL